MKIYFSKYESSSTKILSAVTSAKEQTCDLCLWNSQQQVHLMMRQSPLRLYLSLPYSLHTYQHVPAQGNQQFMSASFLALQVVVFFHKEIC